MRAERRAAAAAAIACAAPLIALGCRAREDAPTSEPDVPPTAVEATFTLTVDGANAALDRGWLEPIADAVRVDGASDRLALAAFAKRAPLQPAYVRVEGYLENRGDLALRDVALDVSSPCAVVDVTGDPFARAPIAAPVAVGGVGPEGIGRFAIDVPRDCAEAVRVRARGVDTKRTSTASSPIVVTPDGAEVWAVAPDADALVAIDARTNAVLARVPAEGRPTSVAVTPDGALLVVACARANRVLVVDRAARAVVQSFDEGDGIGREPRAVVVTPDGGRAFVSAYVGDVVTALRRYGDRFRVEAVVPVGRRPAGMGVAASGRALVVSHFLPRGHVLDNEGWLSVLDVDPPALRGETTLADPLGADRAHCLADTFHVSPLRLTSEGVSTQLAGVFFDPGGATAWIPGARIVPVPIWERGPRARPFASIADVHTGELTAGMTFVLDARDAADVRPLVAPGALERPVDPSYLACERFPIEIEMVGRDAIPSAPGQQVSRFPALPTYVDGLSESGIARAIAFTRGGRRALVVSHTSDEIVVVDAATFHPASQRHLTLSGDDPIGIAVSPDGARAWVAYENTLAVSVIDLSAYADPASLPPPSFVPYQFREVPELPRGGNGITSKQIVRDVRAVVDLPPIREIARVPLVDADPVDPQLRRGAVLFTSSNPDRFPRLSAGRLAACASCHPDGGSDGSVWGTMEGERRTISLRGGVADRGWLHASGTHRDVVDFARTIVRERLGGDLPDDDLQALAAYVARGVPRLQSPRVDEALAARGAELFAARCTGCHAGAQRTSGAPDPSSPFGGGRASGPDLYDVGSATADAHAILGPLFESLLPSDDAALLHALRGDRALGDGDPVQAALDFRPRPARARGLFKAPSLVNAWDDVLFFHDGRAASLDEAVHDIVQRLSLPIDDAGERALVEYLKTL